MNANELAEAMEIRALIRRQATSRKSVQEGANDRLADQLEQAAIMLRQLQAENQEMLDALIHVEVWLDSGCQTGFELKVKEVLRKAQEK